MTISRLRAGRGAQPRARQAATVAVETATFVVMSLGDTRFALAVDAVDRVYRGDAPSSLPRMSLHDALGLAPFSADGDAVGAHNQRSLVLAVDDALAVALVDAVYEVISVDVTAIEPASTNYATPEGLALVRGQFTRHDQVVYLLDVRRVFRVLYSDALRAVAAAPTATAMVP